MVIGNDSIIDSHAISIYLCQKEQDCPLYPKDEMMKAKIHEMLFYNSNTLFPIDSTIFVSKLNMPQLYACHS